MFRNLILLIVIGLVIWLLSQFFKKKPRSQAQQNPKIKNIVQCQQCEVYIPEDQAVKHNGRYFCTQQHLEEWTDKQ